MDPQDLTAAQCVLLTVHLASESNIKALHTFTPSRLNALDPELVLRILLTYLPEAVDPREYTNYIEEVASRLYVNVDREDVEVNPGPVKDLSDAQAQKRVKKLRLLQIQPPAFPPHAPDDLLTRFLCHRAYRIDSETGLLNLVPPLIEPFVNRNEFIRSWYISVVLPLLRMELEYYPGDDTVVMALSDFEKLSGREGVDVLMRKAASSRMLSEAESADRHDMARDIKSLVGPWMYGHSERKRRKLDGGQEREQGSNNNLDTVELKVRKISLDGVTADDKTGHDWEYMYHWMVHHAVDSFDSISYAIEEWDGPSDVDLGNFERGAIKYLDEEEQKKLEAQYAQAAFASCYAAQANSQETVRRAHNVLARLAELLDFVPPPDLATSVDSLPRIERHATKLDQSQTVAHLLPDALLLPEHPLTTPRLESYMLLQMMVYSAYQFDGLGFPLSLLNVAKMHFYATSEEQLEVLKRILRHLSSNGACKSNAEWTADRAKLLWIWSWGIDSDSGNDKEGSGVLGKISKDEFEEELLRTLVETGCYDFASSLYIIKSTPELLPRSRVEQIILDKAMTAYESASNGNKTRGGMKRANDIIVAFRPQFPQSLRFQQATALIAATHSLSFYSLILQHGVPFQPVRIRVSQDPVSLISKVLEQNPRSYTKLDDLVEIARNLASAGLHYDEENPASESSEEPSSEIVAQRRKDAERRVTFMAIEAALRENDFETAYSYIVSRLTPSGTDINGPNDIGRSRHQRTSSRGNEGHDDNFSWRAAFLAGRFRPAESSPPTLRRLEQRTELLSLALLLAPGSALTEILAAWRRCEEEMTSLQLAQQQAEQDFDDRADKRLSGVSSALPGNFTVDGEQPQLILNQKRREMGRMGAASRGNDDTPLSMFDLTRNAARAFSKNAFPLQRGAARSSGEYERSLQGSTGDLSMSGDRPSSPSDGQQRVRKRDMVANAASGALASGLGWVLGATPNQQHE